MGPAMHFQTPARAAREPPPDSGGSKSMASRVQDQREAMPRPALLSGLCPEETQSLLRKPWAPLHTSRSPLVLRVSRLLSQSASGHLQSQPVRPCALRNCDVSPFHALMPKRAGSGKLKTLVHSGRLRRFRISLESQNLRLNMGLWINLEPVCEECCKSLTRLVKFVSESC